MSQQSEVADSIYARLEQGPVAAAEVVRQLRYRWGSSHSVASVHGFVREVATCLLWHGDVEVGDRHGEEFVAWMIEPEDANSRIDSELMSMKEFLEDDRRYVFRKKTA